MGRLPPLLPEQGEIRWVGFRKPAILPRPESPGTFRHRSGTGKQNKKGRLPLPRDTEKACPPRMTWQDMPCFFMSFSFRTRSSGARSSRASSFRRRDDVIPPASGDWAGRRRLPPCLPPGSRPGPSPHGCRDGRRTSPAAAPRCRQPWRRAPV